MVMAVSMPYGIALRMATLLALLFTVSIFSAGIVRLVAWLARGALVHHRLDGVPAWRAGQHPDGAWPPAKCVHHHVCQPARFGAGGSIAVAGAGRPYPTALREQQAQTLRETGRTLEQLNLQLARSNRLKDEFLASVTHELRTPMNGVIGSLELMHTLPMEAEMAQYHRTAVGSAQGMMDMVDAILTLSELQAGRLRAQPAPFSLRALLHGLRAGYAGQALRKGLYLSLDIPADLPDGLLRVTGRS